MEDEHPTIFFGPSIEDKIDSTPPFYVTLTIHDQFLHNCLLDYGVSHKLMPKVVMEKLGLDITKPYHDLYSFNSKRVKCMGLIKDLVVTLTQLPMQSVVMNAMIVGIPPKFGMLLSRSRSKKLGGTLQIDMSYATIPMFGGEMRRLYREVRVACMMSDPKNPDNHRIYVMNEYMGSCVLQLNDSEENCELSVNKVVIKQVEVVHKIVSRKCILMAQQQRKGQEKE